MRNRPTPSASTAPARSRSPSPPMLSSSCTPRPSAVRPGPLLAASAALRRSSRRVASATVVRGGVDGDGAGRPVHEHLHAVVQRAGVRAGDDRGQAQGLGQDRRMAGRPAVLGDDPEHLGGVDGGRVGRGEVGGDEDERVARRRDSRHGQAQQRGDRPGADVVEVGHPLGHVGPCVGQHGAVLLEGAAHRVRSGLALRHALGDLLDEAGVARHHRLGEQHVGGLPAGGGGPRVEVGADGLQRVLGGVEFVAGVLHDRCLRRQLRWRRHPRDGAGDGPGADPDPGQGRAHRTHSLS